VWVLRKGLILVVRQLNVWLLVASADKKWRVDHLSFLYVAYPFNSTHRIVLLSILCLWSDSRLVILLMEVSLMLLLGKWTYQVSDTRLNGWLVSSIPSLRLRIWQLLMVNVVVCFSFDRKLLCSLMLTDSIEVTLLLILKLLVVVIEHCLLVKLELYHWHAVESRVCRQHVLHLCWPLNTILLPSFKLILELKSLRRLIFSVLVAWMLRQQQSVLLPVGVY
jgi:hypothetical protein